VGKESKEGTRGPGQLETGLVDYVGQGDHLVS
jgi:hypothetical protein